MCSRQSFNTILHAAVKLRRKEARRRLKRISSSHKAAALRVSMVVQNGAAPVHSLAMARKAKGTGQPALGFNKAQQQWAVLKGIWPLNANQKPGSKHFHRFRELYAKVKSFPINRKDMSTITEAELAPYHRRAYDERRALAKLCTHCPHHGIFEPARCTSSACRVCGKK